MTEEELLDFGMEIVGQHYVAKNGFRVLEIIGEHTDFQIALCRKTAFCI